MSTEPRLYAFRRSTRNPIRAYRKRVGSYIPKETGTPNGACIRPPLVFFVRFRSAFFAPKGPYIIAQGWREAATLGLPDAHGNPEGVASGFYTTPLGLYRKHFAMTAYPFDTTLDTDELYSSTTLLEASARLNHLLELRAIGLVTGEAGFGKAKAIGRKEYTELRRIFVRIEGARQAHRSLCNCYCNAEAGR
ncbi:MAG: hypothetical protein BECKG1743D_GA0114223_106053 [Candidatus Kentron sp. G]|nr:MAG: hypothetical protein BECKG1743E_GA0114224_105453 [Candidatus Kentron sp. G]VFN04563.1 MAG: hypothetical protein BECKG1743D_GA0114223_106053 [Candidatus Kentron sp. G]